MSVRCALLHSLAMWLERRFGIIVRRVPRYTTVSTTCECGHEGEDHHAPHSPWWGTCDRHMCGCATFRPLVRS
jgi:hypothetical protein